MGKKEDFDVPTMYEFSEARCLEMVQHARSIESTLGQAGFDPPPSSNECSPTFDIVVEE